MPKNIVFVSKRMFDKLSPEIQTATASILGICLVVSAQVLFNILARLGGPNLSLIIPSNDDFAG